MRAQRISFLSLGALLAGLYWLSLARNIPQGGLGADAGDLIAAAAVGGVAHPTGYPTYLLLARPFLYLPVGGLALRAALFSGVSAVMAVLLVLGLLRRSLSGAGVAPATASWLAAAALGVSPLFWSLAVIPEVYALNAAFWGLAAWACIRMMDGRHAPGRRDLSLALLLGIGLGNHITLGLMLPLWLAASVRRAGRSARWQAVARQCAALPAGLLVYLAVPVRAAARPAVNWGNAASGSNFWWLASGQLYHGLLFGGTLAALGERALTWSQALLNAYGPVGLGLVALGALTFKSNRRALWVLAAWSFAVYSFFGLFYHAQDAQAYLLPALAGMALWLGMGLERVLSWIRPRARWGEVAVLATTALAIGLSAIRTYPLVDASRRGAAGAYAEAVMTDAPPGAIIVSTADADTFPLWYTHYALGNRPDVRVVVGPLLGFEWYRAGLESTYPDLTLPETDDPGWIQALLALNPDRAACQTWTDNETGLPRAKCDP